MRKTLLGLLLPLACFGAVTNLRLIERTDFDGGKAQGTVGGYERVRGTLYLAFDPKLAANENVAGLDALPKDENGMALLSVEVQVLKPWNPALGNSTLLVEVTGKPAKSLEQSNLVPQGYLLASINLSKLKPQLAALALRDFTSYLRYGGGGSTSLLSDQRRYIKKVQCYGTFDPAFNKDEKGRLVFDGLWP
jgi:hypothetical protein